MSLDERLDRAEKLVTAGGMTDLATTELKAARKTLAGELRFAASMAELEGACRGAGNALTDVLGIKAPPTLVDELKRLHRAATRLADIERRNQ